ncbi:MAG: hypothetical protein KF779_16040 [Hyphomonadaceae bacterium]|nr:hypothetical protein [Hyphomonadaceae bacterium]
MSFQNHNDRREAADAAKKAMLEKFKNKAAPAALDPEEAAARVKAAEEKEQKRVEAEKARRERVELERLERKVAAEAAAKAERERIAREAKAERERLAREAAEAAKRRKKEAEAAEMKRYLDEARRDLAAAALRKRR